MPEAASLTRSYVERAWYMYQIEDRYVPRSLRRATGEALPAGAERASDLVLLVAGVGFEPTTFGL